MSKVNSIDISISLETLPLPQAGFGMPLVFGEGPSAIAYAEVAELSEMTGLGYTSSDAEYKMVSAIFSQTNRPPLVAIARRIDTDTMTDALDTLILTKNAWYCLLITERTTDELHEAGTWALANEKLFVGGTTDNTDLTDRSNIREAYMVHDDADTLFPDAAWAGQCLPETPGSITWAYQQLGGITESGFNTTVTNQILTDNGNYVGLLNSIPVTYNGKTTGGEFIDIIRGRDYVKARIGEALARLLILQKKIPYTIAGFNLVAAEVRSVLKDCGKKTIVATVDNDDDNARSDNGEYQFIVTVPDSLDDIPANDRANRILPVTFSFRAAGAIHVLDVNGTITA